MKIKITSSALVLASLSSFVAANDGTCAPAGNPVPVPTYSQAPLGGCYCTCTSGFNPAGGSGPWGYGSALIRVQAGLRVR